MPCGRARRPSCPTWGSRSIVSVGCLDARAGFVVVEVFFVGRECEKRLYEVRRSTLSGEGRKGFTGLCVFVCIAHT